jgi:hypothetical protein
MKSKYTTWAYYVGITIVMGTHLYMLGFGLPADQVYGHSILNLVAGGLLAYGWFSR